MIKKLTLATIATAATMALLFIPAQAADGMKCQAGKCGAAMTQKVKLKSDCKAPSCNKSKSCKKGKSCKKMKKYGSPLLVNLPSPMRMLVKMENDPKLALTDEQKTKLASQRKVMMPKMTKLKEDIKVASKAIKEACKKNTPAQAQKANIEKLAILKAEATMTKLTCIEGVKSVLSKEQLAYMKELRKMYKAKKGKMNAMMQNKMGEMKKEMKCQTAKCGTAEKCKSK